MGLRSNSFLTSYPFPLKKHPTPGFFLPAAFRLPSRGLSRAEELLVQSARKAFPPALIRFASYWSASDLQKIPTGLPLAFKACQAAAFAGDPSAQCCLGVMFQEFLHVTLDLNIAHRWLSLSASQGHAEGEARYGVLWEMGWGCEKDPQKAFSLYEKAANKEDPLGQFLLARALGKGQGCEKDPIASANWLLKAAEGGHAASKFLSCLLLLSGSGIPADKQKALEFLCQAADKGCAPAMKMAGVMMKKGICFSKNKPFGRSLIYMAEDMATLPLPAYGQSAIEEESQSPPSWLGKEALEKYSLNPQDLRRIWEGAILEGMAFTDIFFCLC